MNMNKPNLITSLAIAFSVIEALAILAISAHLWPVINIIAGIIVVIFLVLIIFAGVACIAYEILGGD